MAGGREGSARVSLRAVLYTTQVRRESLERFGWELACPGCRSTLERVAEDALRCSAEGLTFRCRGGIWRLLTDERRAETEPFLEGYRRIREDEGFRCASASYIRELPYRDTSGRHPEIWRIRARSFERLGELVEGRGRLRILDLGAGNGWLTRRLVAAGHAVAALDLSDDPLDGLGASRGLNDSTLHLQAAFDQVPLTDGCADLVVFNGSFHYAHAPAETLTESRRLLAEDGRVVIMDTPVYHLERSGVSMVQERLAGWDRRYGDGLASRQGIGFLTYGGLDRLGRAVGLRWQLHSLALGWRWRLGPFVSVLRGRREPARFPFIVGRRSD